MRFKLAKRGSVVLVMALASVVMVGAGGPLLLLQTTPEPTPDVSPGPFANYGQAILAGIIIIMNILQAAFASYMADKREARKEELALKQRELDRAQIAQQRQWDLEDRREARESLDRRLAERGEALERKVEENTKLSKTAAEKATDADDKIARLVKPYNNMVDEDRRHE